MAEELPPDDDLPPERPRRRRDRDREPGAKSGMSTGAIVGIVIGVIALLMCTCGTPIMIGILLPAVQAVREAAAKQQSQNNLKQMSLALSAQSDTFGGAYGPFAQGVGGPAKGHSFRVGLLPFMEQDNLYRAIDLTQPWDSAKNLPLTGTPVKTFLDPGNPASQGTATPYRMFVGPGALFDGSGKPVNLITIPDGSSNTIFTIAATETVAWAKPQELPYGPGVPIPPLGWYPRAGGFNAAFADGSVRFIRNTIAEADLRSLIEAADGRGAGIE